jgi:hypothetical protein
VIIDRPENFFKLFHPQGENCGNIILERSFQKEVLRSRITSSDLEQISKRAYGVKDIYFSTAGFNGRPLIVNFARTTCLHLQVPDQSPRTYLDLTTRLSNIKSIPHPTLAISDGETITLLWMLDTPITAKEFYIYIILQRCLYELASEFNPSDENLEISFLTRVVGSINGNNNNNVVTSRNYGKTHNLKHLKEILLSANTSFSIGKYNQLQTQAGVTLELLSVFNNRWFGTTQNQDLFHDWLRFFGASLCNFCTTEQLENELKAIAESLEAKKWKTIKSEYQKIIESIISTSTDGYISFTNASYAINHPKWSELIQERLKISSNEIKLLNLQTISGSSSISPYLHDDIKETIAVGESDFVPISRLLLKAS